MIPLFKIYKPEIDFENFNHNLHGQIVTDFENAFADYMGVKYAIGINSCTSAIFLTVKWCQLHYKICSSVNVPTMIPPVVLNALYHADADICFQDDTKWIGGHYFLKQDSVFAIIDSAHEVDNTKIEKFNKAVINRTNPENRWAALYSFYPTKPISGIDGGMVITNNKALNEWLRRAIMNGTSPGDSWDRQITFPGWKYYLSTAQAFVAYQQFIRLDVKNKKLAEIRDAYNKAFKLKNTSDHLYRIKVKNNIDFIVQMESAGIKCGIHYRCTHKEPAYKGHTLNCSELYQSERMEKKTVSIPFYEDLTTENQNYIIEKVQECQQ